MIHKNDQANISPINFETKLFKIGDSTILKLPQSASDKLPSRGQTMVEGTINNYHFQSPLEPDGKASHWLNVDEKKIKASAGETVKVEMFPTKDWPEPNVPEDLKDALKTNAKAHTLWEDITPMARWDWIRWIRGTKNPETRKRRIEVSISKLKSGMRRPCCFNRSMCTDPYVSNNGFLLEPTQI